jgi:preprotein translocase subunit SecF
MIRIFNNANYDFFSVWRKAILATAAFFALGVVALLARGLNYSIEFTGGTLVQIEAPAQLDVGGIRSGLTAGGLPGAELTPFDEGRGIDIRARTAAEGTDAENTEQTRAAVVGVLDQVVGAGNYTVNYSEAVSPKVGGELRTQAFFAIFLSFFAVLAYLAYRFEWRFGLAAVIATAHDIVLTICFIAIMHFEVSLVVIAAILSMVGYSLNDTIIIFDRVRENLHKHRRDQLVPVINRSVNETLPRSVLTHATTLAALAALLVFGGEVIRPFAAVMAFGVFTGTFSSIFVAGPVLHLIEQRYPGVDGRGIKVAPRVKARPGTV